MSFRQSRTGESGGLQLKPGSAIAHPTEQTLLTMLSTDESSDHRVHVVHNTNCCPQAIFAFAQYDIVSSESLLKRPVNDRFQIVRTLYLQFFEPYGNRTLETSSNPQLRFR
ncbi:MAG: hypothetical protein FJ267_17635 [Planctomycetes bacterium]|nr:hypothetical protein [Planctomycetota bacterium]